MHSISQGLQRIIFLIIIPSIPAFVWIALPEDIDLTISLALICGLIIPIIVYPLLPFRYSVAIYYERKGHQNVIADYFLTKKILIVAIILIVVLSVILGFAGHVDKDTRDSLQNYLPGIGHLIVSLIEPSLITNILVALRVILFVIVYATLTRMILQISRRGFRFYFSKGCFQMVSKVSDEVERVKYLMLGFDFYDTYLRKI